jgi:hypothetical protein
MMVGTGINVNVGIGVNLTEALFAGEAVAPGASGFAADGLEPPQAASQMAAAKSSEREMERFMASLSGRND